MNILSFFLSFLCVPAMGAPEPIQPRWMTVACEQEDSTNCYWDAGKVGNRKGHSFYSIPSKGKTCIVYWNTRFGKSNNYCI